MQNEFLTCSVCVRCLRSWNPRALVTSFDQYGTVQALSKCQSVSLSVLQVFKGITDWELDVLDIFEDEEYVRETVSVSLTVSPFISISPKRDYSH